MKRSAANPFSYRKRMATAVSGQESQFLRWLSSYPSLGAPGVAGVQFPSALVRSCFRLI
jgi:hypothetical protein